MLVNANSLRIPLAPKSVHMVATSPPYFALRNYNTGSNKALEIGTEDLHDCLAWARREEPCGKCYVCAMRLFGREIWRVLRDDGTFFLNLGDSYSGSGKAQSGDGTVTLDPNTKQATNRGGTVGGLKTGIAKGLQAKDLIGIPWRVALALQSDGWLLRSDIIWSKKNPMPSAVTDRPSTSHEYIFLLAKNKHYFYDSEAVKEKSSGVSGGGFSKKYAEQQTNHGAMALDHPVDTGKRNLRTVWTLSTQPFKGAHYATWPEKLVEKMIFAGTSERGCCGECGKQLERVIERKKNVSRDMEAQRDASRNKTGRIDGFISGPEGKVDTVSTVGFRATCDCNSSVIQSIVLDPFCGSGTTGAVARRLGRRFIGLDLSMTYLHDHALARAEGLTPLDKIKELPMFGETE